MRSSRFTWSETSLKSVRPAKDLLTLESVSIGKAGKMEGIAPWRKRRRRMANGKWEMEKADGRWQMARCEASSAFPSAPNLWTLTMLEFE